MDSIVTREFRSGDEAAILRLYRETFDTVVSEGYWRWKYLDNPSGKIYVELAFDRERCVGQYAMLPMSLSVDGKPCDVLVALDNMVHPDYQRRGILKRCEAGLARRRPGDIPYYTFLNENSFHMYVKHFGWTYMGELPVLLKPLGVDSLVRRSPAWKLLQPFFAAYRKLYSSRTGSIEACPVECFSAAVESLWQRVKDSPGVTFDRSSKWLDWRFVAAPVDYDILELRRSGELCGYAVVRVEEKFGLNIGWILDLLVDGLGGEDQAGPPQGQRFGEALLAVEERMSGRCDFLSLVAPRAGLSRSCRRVGFRRLPSRLLPHQFYFCTRANVDSAAAVVDREQWYFTWSLHDVL